MWVWECLTSYSGRPDASGTARNRAAVWSLLWAAQKHGAFQVLFWIAYVKVKTFLAW